MSLGAHRSRFGRVGMRLRIREVVATRARCRASICIYFLSELYPVRMAILPLVI